MDKLLRKRIYFYASSFSSTLLILSSFGFLQATSFSQRSPHLQQFDFIIVGGGTAGCVLANRLSEHFSVLLLEAGGVPPDFMNIPALAKRNELLSEYTYQYHSVPQRYAAFQTNVIRISLGRMLGGTSQINYSIFNRGNPHDYDNWANYTGDPTWTYENMLPYFKMVETYFGQYPSDQHGFNGPISVSYQKYAPGREAWLDAGKELGYRTADANGPQIISFTPIEFARHFGRRVSSFAGYIKPIMNSRKNLKIITHATVNKILFAGKTAVGVKYSVDNTEDSAAGTSRTSSMGIVFAKREIILSAGAYGSATLLMRSGIGPREVLTQAQIPILKDLPVGENLQEHPVVPMHFVLNNKSLSFDPENDLTPENHELYEQFGTGPYSSIAGYSGQAFIASSVAQRDSQHNWPDIHLCMTAYTNRLEPFQNISLAPWETTIIMNLYLGRGKSRGTVKLDPENPNDQPLIDFNYLSNISDEEVWLDAIDATLKIFEETNVYRELEARYPTEKVPACSHLKFRSRSYWKCFMRETTIPGNHPAGTCAMNHVVDSNLKVYSINRLRVVDASVMPFITNSNIHAAVFGIAEKAAATILHEWSGHAHLQQFGQ